MRSFGDKRLGFSGLQKEKRTQDFIHNIVNGRRKSLTIKKIQKPDGMLVEGPEQVVEKAVSLFQDQFTDRLGEVDLSLVEHIPFLVLE